MSERPDGVELLERTCEAGGEVAGRVTRRSVISGMVAVTAASMLDGCGNGVGAPGQVMADVPPRPAVSQSVPMGSVTVATLSVNSTGTGSIGPEFMGISFDKGAMVASPALFMASNTDLVNLFKLVGVTVLRIGGNTVDQNTWAPAGPGATPGQIAPADIDALAGFVQAAGCKCLYGVNLGGVGLYPYVTGSLTARTTPDLAAGEIAYLSQKMGAALFGVEIGNEPDQYGATYFSGTTWEPADFEVIWETFRAAIVAETPGALITGPATLENTSTWTIPFGECVTSRNLSLLTQHYYRGGGESPNSTSEFMLSPDVTLLSELTAIQSACTSTIGIPYRISECNVYSFPANAAPSEGLSDANGYAAALWVLDFLFDCALNGATGVNIHNGGGSGSGSRPIQETNGTIVSLRPEYYGMLLFSLAGQGQLLTTTLSGLNGLNATAYAVQSAAGGVNIVLVNKDSSNDLQISINLPRVTTSATLLQMAQLSTGASGPSLTATTGVTIQGAAVGANGSFTPGAAYSLSLGSGGAECSCYVPYQSAVLIQIQ